MANINPDKERERSLVLELYEKGNSHTDIARCIARERKIFNIEQKKIGEILIEVENIILDRYRRKNEDT